VLCRRSALSVELLDAIAEKLSGKAGPCVLTSVNVAFAFEEKTEDAFEEKAEEEGEGEDAEGGEPPKFEDEPDVKGRPFSDDFEQEIAGKLVEALKSGSCPTLTFLNLAQTDVKFDASQVENSWQKIATAWVGCGFNREQLVLSSDEDKKQRGRRTVSKLQALSKLKKLKG
jgi:hypothetical protein